MPTSDSGVYKIGKLFEKKKNEKKNIFDPNICELIYFVQITFQTVGSLKCSLYNKLITFSALLRQFTFQPFYSPAFTKCIAIWVLKCY